MACVRYMVLSETLLSLHKSFFEQISNFWSLVCCHMCFQDNNALFLEAYQTDTFQCEMMGPLQLIRFCVLHEFSAILGKVLSVSLQSLKLPRNGTAKIALSNRNQITDTALFFLESCSHIHHFTHLKTEGLESNKKKSRLG